MPCAMIRVLTQDEHFYLIGCNSLKRRELLSRWRVYREIAALFFHKLD